MYNVAFAHDLGILADLQPGRRHRLSDLRATMSGTRRQQNEAIRAALEAGWIEAMPLDDPRERLAGDRDAAWYTPSGSERHIVYSR